MKKYFLLLMAFVVVLSLATITYAQPILKLDVLIDNSKPNNVTYVATLIPAITNAKIDFYTEPVHDIMPPFPTRYVGSAPTDNNGVAKLSFTQASGPWAGGAIWMDGTNTTRSNVVYYIIP